MSGTSPDGVDAAWPASDGQHGTAFGAWLMIPCDDRARRVLRAILGRAAGR
jgi:1,6-anhydro-N-acetylmuramate kinase